MKVRVNGGDPGWFVFDTGAAVSAISTAWAKTLNLDPTGIVKATGSGGSASGGLVKNVIFVLPGVSVPAKTVAVLNLSQLPPLLGHDVDGIIGYDVISRFVVRIDYGGKEITLSNPANFQYSGEGTVLPLRIVGNRAQIPVRILLPGRAPIDTTANIDTGASGIQLTTHFVESHDVLSAVGRTIAKPTVGIGGTSEALEGRIGAIQVGTYLLKQPAVIFMRTSRGALSNPEFGVNMGGEVLARFVTILDYERKSLFLEPTAHLY